MLKRLESIIYILFYRNFILITGIKEKLNTENKPVRRMRLVRRTDYDHDSDILTCIAASEICKYAKKIELPESTPLIDVSLTYKKQVIDEIERVLMPKNETDKYNWNQIRKAIDECNLDI